MAASRCCLDGIATVRTSSFANWSQSRSMFCQRKSALSSATTMRRRKRLRSKRSEARNLQTAVGAAPIQRRSFARRWKWHPASGAITQAFGWRANFETTATAWETPRSQWVNTGRGWRPPIQRESVSRTLSARRRGACAKRIQSPRAIRGQNETRVRMMVVALPRHAQENTASTARTIRPLKRRRLHMMMLRTIREV